VWQALQRWFIAVPYSDPLSQRLAFMFQTLLFMVIIGGIVDVGMLLIANSSQPSGVVVSVFLVIFELGAIAALVMLRRGMMQRMILLVLVVFGVIASVVLVLFGLQQHSLLLFMWMLPIVLVGTLLDRKWLVISTVCGMAIVLILSSAEQYQFWWVNRIDIQTNSADILRFFTILLIIVVFAIEQLSDSFHKVMQLYKQRSVELTKIHEDLERLVAERNENLFDALQASQQRALQLRNAMKEIEQQRQLIHSLEVPIIPISSTTVVMPLIGSLDEKRFLQIREQALRAIERSSVKQLVLDITGVPLVDDVMTRGLIEIVQATDLLGVETVLVGIRPEVAYSIVQLQGDFPHLRTASTLQAFLS